MRKNNNNSLPFAYSFDNNSENPNSFSFCERKVEELQALKSKYGFLKNSYVFSFPSIKKPFFPNKFLVF